MQTRKNTIGVVHWGQLWTGTTGERIAVVITAYFQGNHVPYLRDILTSRLPDWFEHDEDLHIEFVAGELRKSERGTAYDSGTIAIYGVTEPWPEDGPSFRKSFEEAFAQAGEVEAAQMTLADALKLRLLDGWTPGA